MNAPFRQNLVGDPVCVSVLMSTYARESAHHLEESLASLYLQTRIPDEIVLVVDGPIDNEQEEVIAKYERAEIPLIVVRKEVQAGLALAMNTGLEHCRGRYVMRMDADDICERDRVELQVEFLQQHPEIDLLGGWIQELSDDDMLYGVKASPCHHEELAKALRFRNVISHPTVIMRRKTLIAVGAYRTDFGLLEDYDLFVRFVEAGAKLHVIPKVLLRARTSKAQRARRGGLEYLRGELAFRRSCFRRGFLTPREFVLTTALYSAFRLIGPLRRSFYGLART